MAKATTSTPDTAPKRRVRKISMEDLGEANFGVLSLTLEGTAPLLVQRFSQKAIDDIAAKQQGRASSARKKAPKDPEADFLNSMHIIGPRPRSVEELEQDHTQFRFGLHATAFKHAVCRMAKVSGLMPMTDARTVMHIVGDAHDRELVELKTPTPPKMHTGTVRVGAGTTDLRYRAMFDPWSVDLTVNYHARMVSAEQLFSLFVDAGLLNGVGDFRPAGRSSTGMFGTFKVASAKVNEPDFA